MWTSREHREGNEVKGRRGSRAWRKGEREGGKEGGRSHCIAGWDALSRTEAERHKNWERCFTRQNIGARDGAFSRLKHLET